MAPLIAPFIPLFRSNILTEKPCATFRSTARPATCSARAIAARYGERLSATALSGRLTLPPEAPGRRHVYHQYVVRVAGRDRVRKSLSERGIGTAVFYPIPLHLQDCFLDLGGRDGDFPAAEQAAREALALPMFAELTDLEIERVAEALSESLA